MSVVPNPMNRTEHTVLTLDAGGTNLVFSALRDGERQGEDFVLETRSGSLEEFLQKLVHGFRQVLKQGGDDASAISFAFPGPADYERGIIGDLENLPWFRGGVPLKTMLENEFRIPVFINNDGDLFALGEARGGLLPRVNKLLREEGSEKQYKNLLGLTLGTGFGGGIVSDQRLWHGDNSAGAEINRMSNPLDRQTSVEEVLSIRGIKRLFSEKSGCAFENTPSPLDIFRIGTGTKKGDKDAALAAWEDFALVLADAVGNTLALVDGLVVIGGGLAGAHPLFLEKVVGLLNGSFSKSGGGKFPRLEVSVFNLEDPDGLAAFLQTESHEIAVPFSEERISWQIQKKAGIGITRLGTSEAIALGAYVFAIDQLT